MPKSKLDDFYATFVEAIEKNEAALFAGAGFSIPAGYVNWKELLRDIANELNLDVDKESDLVSLAQYHRNETHSRVKLNKLLINEFTKDIDKTENHPLVADLPIDTIWTTNYDDLIENAFRRIGKRVDVKIKQQDLVNSFPNHSATVYKMHGDISDPANAVLIKKDYETYARKRGLFTTVLEGHLITKTFLFLGFSFADPNIDYVLGRIGSVLGENPREHFCIMKTIDKPKPLRGKKKADYEYETRKLELRIADLARYGITTLMIEDYGEITKILRELNRRIHRKNVFVSGSAHDYVPLEKARIDDLSYSIGKEIIKRGFNLVSGYGLGIGGTVIVGTFEALYSTDSGNKEKRTVIRPFPLPKPELWTKHRQEMISNAGFTVFLCGNKLDEENGETIFANGLQEEFEITKKLEKYPIPIGATGWVAREIWEEVTENLDKFYPKGGVKGHFKILGDPEKSNEEFINAIFAIMSRVT